MKTSLVYGSALGLGLAVLLATVSAHALSDVPVPAMKPLGFAATKADPPSFETTGAIPRGERLASASPQLKSGLDALSDKDGAQAIAIRNRMPEGLDRQMLTWSIAMSGLRDVPATEIAAAQRQLQGWPGSKPSAPIPKRRCSAKIRRQQTCCLPSATRHPRPSRARCCCHARISPPATRPRRRA